MNFLAPAAFALGLLLPVIVALYLLKLRRVEREVPSTYLWRKMVRDVEANAPWQKLRPNLLMILQLIFLALLILALARPFQWAEGAGGEATIIVIDTSASMSAVDVQPSRLESAKARARQIVDELPSVSRVTIIEAGSEARVLISASLDRRQAHLALEQIRPGTGGSDMSVSLELASAIASRQPNTEIIVLSDGRVELPARLSIKGSLRYIPFGLNGENLSISLLTLEPSAGGAGLTAFIQVTNHGQSPASRQLLLTADDMPVNNYPLEDIRPGGQKNVIEEGLPPETRVVTAQLLGSDALSLDDTVTTVHPDTRPVPVTLVTRGNLFLTTGLSLLPGVSLTGQEAPSTGDGAPADDEAGEATATPAPSPTAPQTDPDEEAPGIWIFDGFVPDALPAAGSLLFIAPPRSTDLFRTTGVVESPAARVIDPADPLVKNISLDETSLLDAVEIPLPDWATPVVSGDLEDSNTPLIFRGEVRGRRVAVIAFDLRRSDLPLQVAFPLLLTNLVEWLAPGAGSIVPPQIAAGEALAFNAPQGVQSATITQPDGATVQVQAENGRFVFPDTTRLGLYSVRFVLPDGEEETEASFAVNLMSPQESNLDPAASLPGLEAQTAEAGNGPLRSMREWWRPLALLALGVLAGEWLVYQRGALARLRDLFLRSTPRGGFRRPQRQRKGSP